MIVQKSFINKLKDFGLNSYESKLWTALLSRGVSTAGELSDIANVPRSRSYDVLESLEKKGFIIMKIGKPIKYIAVSPEEVIERVKKKIRQDSEKQIEVVAHLRESEVLKELKTLHSKGIDLVEPTELSGALKGRNNVYDQMESMIKNAEKSVVIMTSPDGLVRKADAFKNALTKAKKRGVKVRIAAPLTKETEKATNGLKSVAEVKNIDKIKSRFMIADGKEMVFMLMNDDKVHPSYDMGIWVKTPFFASALQSMFDLHWEKA